METVTVTIKPKTPTTWNFQATLLATFWNGIMQWRYVRIFAFAWIVLGYSRGWELSTHAFTGIVVAIMVCLPLCSLVDAIHGTWRIHRNRKSLKPLLEATQ